MNNREERPALTIAKAFTDSSGGLAVATAGVLLVLANVSIYATLVGVVMALVGFVAAVARFALETVEFWPGEGRSKLSKLLTYGVITAFFGAFIVAAIAGGKTAADALRPPVSNQTAAAVPQPVILNIFLQGDRVSETTASARHVSPQPVAGQGKVPPRAKPKCRCRGHMRN